MLLKTTLCAFSGFGKGNIIAQNVGTKIGLIGHIYFGIFCTGCPWRCSTTESGCTDLIMTGFLLQGNLPPCLGIPHQVLKSMSKVWPCLRCPPNAMAASLEEHIKKEEYSVLRHLEEETARSDFNWDLEEEVESSDDSEQEEDSEDSEEEEEEGDEE